MKNNIPSYEWEKRKDLITKLYRDDGWPLKLVIRQIRSRDFNPRFDVPQTGTIRLS